MSSVQLTMNEEIDRLPSTASSTPSGIAGVVRMPSVTPSTQSATAAGVRMPSGTPSSASMVTAAGVQTSRSSLSTIDSESFSGNSHVGFASSVGVSGGWTSLETASRLLALLSLVFFVIGVILTIFGFADVGVSTSALLPLQITGPVCLATTVVMWMLGVVFNRLWKAEWRRKQQALEMRARVQMNALAMDILKKPMADLSPSVFRDPRWKKQMMQKSKLRKQSTVDVR